MKQAHANVLNINRVIVMNTKHVQRFIKDIMACCDVLLFDSVFLNAQNFIISYFKTMANFKGKMKDNNIFACWHSKR
jgi:hypothetical protein